MDNKLWTKVKTIRLSTYYTNFDFSFNPEKITETEVKKLAEDWADENITTEELKNKQISVAISWDEDEDEDEED